MSHLDGFISGSVAGAAGLVVGHPFDTVKVRLQTTQLYSGFSNCCKKVIAEEGFRALYKGMLAPMASVSLMNAVFFGVYTSVLQCIDDDIDTPRIWSTYVAGTASGLLAGCISGPTELIKCRLQVSGMSICPKAPKRGNMEVIRDIVSKDGIRGLGRGLGVTIARELVSCGFYFAVYEWIIQYFRGDSKDITDLTTFHLILAGGVSGMLSWGVNYPIDVVKSRIQIDGMDGPRKYSSTANCFKLLHKQAGSSGLYRGVSATLFRAFPTNAAMLPAYSVTLSLLTKFRNEKQLHY